MAAFLRSFVALGLAASLIVAPACGNQTGTTDTGTEATGTEATGETLDEAVGNAGPAEFNLDLALELALLCLYSYQMLIDYNNGVSFTIPSEYTLIEQFLTQEGFLGEDDTPVPIAYIATKGNAIYLVFRGTKTIVEWIDDAEIFQEKYPIVANGGKTEVGFTDLYLTINTGIIEKINELAESGSFSTIYVMGHSLGSSLSTLAIPDVIKNTRFNHPILYNFASPRVGDPDFATFTIGGTNTTHWRVANTNDVVPKLPPVEVVKVVNGSYTFFFFEHITKLFSITFGKPVVLAEGQQVDDSIIGDIGFNHSLCHYINTLCGMTSDPDTCKAPAKGVDECNEDS